MNKVPQNTILNTEKIAQDILASVDKDREREIVARRYGLFDRRETLEQIGELLGITRERVRQLEKSVMARLRVSAEQGKLSHIEDVETTITYNLQAMGNAARVSALAAKITAENSKTDQSRLAFLAVLCPGLTVTDDNDSYFQAISLTSVHDTQDIQANIVKIIDTLAKIGEPAVIADVAKKAGIASALDAEALASISRQLAALSGRWGLIKWPTVNPRNIRDKIYVILKAHGAHMHFNDISAAIRDSEFKRKDVTTQAIHNELIKDKRFVLIGRGIYALTEWGYNKGTVSDIIASVLRDAKEPLHRDEIVNRVLKTRFVKETTILLNLQSKSQFKRVAKATYQLDEAA